MKIQIVRSHLPSKKFDAIFTDKGKVVKVIPFGARGYLDFTITGDVEKRRLYRLRHAKDNLEHADSPGALSMYILWGNSTDIRKNVMDYKRRFRLHD